MNISIFDSFPILETERLTLQLHTLEDAQDFYLLRSDPEIMRFMDQSPARSIEEVKSKILEIQHDFKNKKGINWAIKLKGSTEALGYMSLWRIDHENHRAEIGYALKKEYWNQGISYEAAQAVIDFGFYKLQAHSMMANISPLNVASKNFIEKLGFKQEAYFREDFHFNGKFLDSAIYCTIISDWEKRSQLTNH